MQLPAVSMLGFLLPSTAKDGPFPESVLIWNVDLPSAKFTGSETRNLYLDSTYVLLRLKTTNNVYRRNETCLFSFSYNNCSTT